MIGALVLLAIIVLLVLWIIAAYNGLIGLKNRVANAWKQIDVQLKRRHDLIPNLVNTVKGAMDFERNTLEAVIAARNKAVNATGVAATAKAEGELTQALGRLFALTEAYPALKATGNVAQLQEELTSTENKIGFARQLYGALHALEDAGVTDVLLEEPPAGAAWAGVRDRLQRAAG